MSENEEVAYDFCGELLRNKGVSETTYRRAVTKFGENGVIDMIGVAGYFTTVSMVMNVAHSPPSDDKFRRRDVAVSALTGAWPTL